MNKEEDNSDKYNIQKHHISTGAIVGISLGSYIGFIFLIWLVINIFVLKQNPFKIIYRKIKNFINDPNKNFPAVKSPAQVFRELDDDW